MPYTDRYVAFVDILGFKEIIRKSAGNDQMISALVEAIRSMGSDIDPDLAKTIGKDFKAQNLSDAVLMSENVSASGLSSLIYQIQELALRLLGNGLLVRGGISKGGLYQEDQVIFGPAFVEAYRLESSVAKVPRIVLAREVHEDVVKYGEEDERWEHDFKSDLRYAEDGPVFVHVLKRFQKDLTGDPDEVVEAQFCQAAVKSLIEATMYEPRHFEKVKWFALYWNASVAGIGPLTEVSLPYTRSP
jgi:hypothetical protein